jgi:hypothetical protein
MTTEARRAYQRAYYVRNRERIAQRHKDYYARNFDRIAAYKRRYREQHGKHLAAYGRAYRSSAAGQAVKRREQAKLRRIPASRGGIPWTTADDAIVCRADLTLFEMAEMSPDRGTCDSPDSTADHPTYNAASLQQS